MVTVLVPHVGGPILPPGAPTVLIDFLPAATVTSMATCVGPPDVIIMGSTGVLINFLPAARLGDPTAHGGVIILGSPTCIIGETGSPSPGGGGAGAIAAGLVVAGVANPINPNASAYSKSLTSSTDPWSGQAANYPDTPLGRMKKAQDFYSQTGWDDQRIKEHLRGIDFSQPVDVVTLEPGDEVKQWVKAGSGPGSYFDADSSPEELGLYPLATQARELRTFIVNKKTQVLKSTAAPIDVDWVPGKPPFHAKGGAKQMFNLPANKGNFSPGASGPGQAGAGGAGS
jgi:uncharacterized Zn-binding protein involved in type VI secretion